MYVIDNFIGGDRVNHSKAKVDVSEALRLILEACGVDQDGISKATADLQETMKRGIAHDSHSSHTSQNGRTIHD